MNDPGVRIVPLKPKQECWIVAEKSRTLPGRSIVLPHHLRNTLGFIAGLLVSAFLFGCDESPQHSQLRVVVEKANTRTSLIHAYALVVRAGEAVPVSMTSTSKNESSTDWLFGLDASYGRDSVCLVPNPNWRVMETAPQISGARVVLRVGDTLRLRRADYDSSTTFSIAIDVSYRLPTPTNSDWTVISRDVTDHDSMRFRTFESHRFNNYAAPTVIVIMEYNPALNAWQPTGRTVSPQKTGSPAPRTKRNLAYYWANGNLRKQEVCEDSLSPVVHIWYDTTGTEFARAEYGSNGPNGTVAEFWPNGQLKCLTHYRDGLMVGNHEYWHVNGASGGKSPFRLGNGVIRHYYADGTPMYEAPYVGGRLHGIVKELVSERTVERSFHCGQWCATRRTSLFSSRRQAAQQTPVRL